MADDRLFDDALRLPHDDTAPPAKPYGCPKCRGPVFGSLEEAEAHVCRTGEFLPIGGHPTGAKDTNPKDGLGALKLPLHLVPVTALAYAAIALHNGRGKYGAHNWRAAGVRASIYLDALDRHMKRWINGEEVDPEDGVPNLAGAMACLCILIDARAAGKLTDDRPPSIDVARFFSELTPLVVALNEKHAGRNPRHYTIEDTKP